MIQPHFDPATDYYGILGVKPNATPREIHAAYRRLARVYHPDIHPGSTAARMHMARVNVAKSVLLDPRARAAYDASRRGANLSVHQLHPRPTTRKRSEQFDSGTAIMLVVVAPLVIGLLLYLVSGVEAAIPPLPALPCC